MKTYLFFSLFLISLSSFAQQNPWIDFNRNGVLDNYGNPELKPTEEICLTGTG